MRSKLPVRALWAFFLFLALPSLTNGLRAAGQEPSPSTDPAPASVHDPAEVIAYKGDAVLTQREIDAAFSKLPEQDASHSCDGAKVDN
jgi:hypothetical protein